MLSQTFSLAEARELDAADPLSKFRERFIFPQHNGENVLYFTGNSLGLQPKSALDALQTELEDWAEHGVEGHFRSRNPWMHYHELFSDHLASIVGAKPSEVVAMNALTVNLHLLLISFYNPKGSRKKIICEAKAFPSDRYALLSQIAFHGGDPAKDLIEIAPRDGEELIHLNDVLTGCISPRRIRSEVKRYECTYKPNQSTYWIVFELMWRDYFKFIAIQHGSRIFHKSGLKRKLVPGNQNKKLFDEWKKGATSDAFVNANMRELLNTGYMSNRGRQNVASYLIHDLGIDWRLGASWFEHLLLDYDPSSNVGNWIYIAGVGNDPRPVRKFNTSKQAETYDRKKQYRNLWNSDITSVNL